MLINVSSQSRILSVGRINPPIKHLTSTCSQTECFSQTSATCISLSGSNPPNTVAPAVAFTTRRQISCEDGTRGGREGKGRRWWRRERRKEEGEYVYEDKKQKSTRIAEYKITGGQWPISEQLTKVTTLLLVPCRQELSGWEQG